MFFPAGTAVPATTSRDGTWAELSADLVHAGRSCAPRTESDAQGDPGMTLCMYLGLESNKPETQLVRTMCFSGTLHQGQIQGKNTSPHVWSIRVLSSRLPPLALLRHLHITDKHNSSVPCPETSQSQDLHQGSPLVQPAREGGMSLGKGGEAVGHCERGQVQLICISLTTDKAKMWSESSPLST